MTLNQTYKSLSRNNKEQYTIIYDVTTLQKTIKNIKNCLTALLRLDREYKMLFYQFRPNKGEYMYFVLWKS